MSDASAPKSPHGRRVFALTWLSYASYYLTRKNFAVAKKSLERDLSIDRAALARIDTGYLAAYSIGQLVFGALGDRVGARRVLGAGMLATALCSLWFGASSTAAGFGMAFAVNGLAQASGWPSNVKLMAEHHPATGRGRVMGFWSTNYQIGSLVANPIAGALLLHLGWRAAFRWPAAFVATVGVVVFVMLPRSPASSPTVRSLQAPLDAAARRRVYRTPLVWALGSSYFFIKLTRYVLLFWLPYYMEARDGLGYAPSLAANVPLAFEAGGAVGAIAIGWLSDRFLGGRRLVAGMVCLVGLALALPLYAFAAPHGVAANIAALALVGFLLFGPDTLLSGAAAQDLGGPAAAATAAGLINAIGSLGAIAQGPVTAHVSARFGWGPLFSLLGIGALLGAAILVPFARRRRETG